MHQRPSITLIAAVARNGVIGRGNGLPWHLPADLAHFKRATMGKSMIMGRRTWESLPGLLPHRSHIVLTRAPGFGAEGAMVAKSFEEALTLAGGDEVMIIGGAQVYALALPLADRMLLTEIQADVEGDTHFPYFDASEWREVERQTYPANGRNPLPYAFVVYRRIK